MRIVQILVFAVVFLACLVLALANYQSLMTTTNIFIPILGKQSIQARLFGLIALPTLAGLYTFFGSLQGLGANARSAKDLRQIDELRKSLDKEEANRFKALQASLDSHAKNIIGKLEMGVAAPQPQNTQDSKITDKTMSSFNARVDKLRDELAADIAHSEETLHQKLDAMLAATDKR